MKKFKVTFIKPQAIKGGTVFLAEQEITDLTDNKFTDIAAPAGFVVASVTEILEPKVITKSSQRPPSLTSSGN